MNQHSEIFLIGAGLAYVKPENEPSAYPTDISNPSNPSGAGPLPHNILSALQGTNEAALRAELASALPDFKARRVPGGVKMALLAATRACRAAGFPPAGLSARCGLYIGAGNGAAENTLNFIDGLLADGPRLASPTFFSYSVSNTFAGMMAATLGLQGPAITCSQEGLSLYGALLSAWLDLASGDTDMSLVGVVEENHPVLAKIRAFNGCAPQSGACAAFFLLSREQESGAARLFMPCLSHEKTSKNDPRNEMALSLFQQWLPAAQGINLAVAWELLRDGATSAADEILCFESPANGYPGCIIRLGK